MIHIQIPATSANMGPGFDSIGVAVQLYNHIWVEEQTDGLTIEVRRKQELEVPTDETNLIYQTMKFFYEKKELPMPGIHLIQEDYIPMVRGLGSSAACIVGGFWRQTSWQADPAPETSWHRWRLCWRDIRIIPTLRSLAAWWSAHRMKKK